MTQPKIQIDPKHIFISKTSSLVMKTKYLTYHHYGLVSDINIKLEVFSPNFPRRLIHVNMILMASSSYDLHIEQVAKYNLFEK